MRAACDSFDEDFELRLEQLEYSHQTVQEQFANAVAAYETLRGVTDPNDGQLRHALECVSRAQRLLIALRNQMARLEDQNIKA
jgi:hypothetical protein